MNKFINIILLSMLISVSLSIPVLAAGEDGSGSGGSVVTISGKFEGARSIADGTTKVILDNVDAMSEDNELYLPAGIILELKEETINRLNMITGEGDLTIKGAGSLNDGQGIVTSSGTLTIALEEPGAIELPTGIIMNYDGSVVIESGTVTVGSDGVLGGRIVALGGDLRIKGGNVSAGGSTIGLFSEGKIQFLGGKVLAGGSSMAVMAVGGIEQDNGNPEQMDILVMPNENGDRVAYAATEGGSLAKGFRISKEKIETAEEDDTGLLSAPSSEFSQRVNETMPEYEKMASEDIEELMGPDNDENDQTTVTVGKGIAYPEGTELKKASAKISPLTVTESRSGELMGEEDSKVLGGSRLKQIIFAAGIAIAIAALIVGIIAIAASHRKKK
jgi:hypothetical protein